MPTKRARSRSTPSSSQERIMLEDENGTPGVKDSGVTRREFIATGLAAGAAVALGAALPAATESAVAQAPAGPAVGQTLVPIAEIGKTTPAGPVQAVIKILNENKTYIAASKATPGNTTLQSGQMRYFAGGPKGGADVWPPKNGNP